jgi:prephenate dehydrogenase
MREYVMDYKKVTIIGVGLIGGSFALSLRKSGYKGTITGVGRKKENLLKARDLGVIDEFYSVPSEGVKGADLIMLSTPVGQFPHIVEGMRGHVKKGAIVTDAGSVKAEVIRKLEPLMPEDVFFVGVHPIAGKECSGVDAASSDLFNGAICIITPSVKTDKSALEKVIATWKVFGSKTVIMDPDEHDSIFAAVSHMPHVISYVLINAIMDNNGGILSHGGRGLRDMTRIALSPPDLWRDICVYNKDNILRSLRDFLSSASRVEKLIENSDWDSLWKEFQKAKAGRQILETD